MSTLKTTNLQHASAGSPAIVLASDGTATAQLSSLNGGPLAGARNRIINGDMRISQRGTSFAAIASDTYSLDRWLWSQSGAMICTVSQSSDVPNNTFYNSYKVDVTTVDSSIAASDYALVWQRIEGFNVRDLINTTFTLSFWVKSPKTGVHCISFRNNGSDRSYIKEYTVVSANTWEYKTITVSGGLITSGTWDWTNGSGLEILFSLATGATFQTSADAWQTGNYFATANQVNVMDNTANDFFLTGVQLEPGSVATPFERRSYGQELSLCQRYYEQVNAWWVSDVQNTSTYGTAFVFAVEKRATPTMASISQGGAANGSMNTRTPSAFSSRKGGATTATASTTIVSAGFNDVYSASAEL
jgi:hypothetical protein